MQTNRSRWVWVRISLAALLAFVVFAAIFPNLARPVTDQTLSPPKPHFVTKPGDVLFLIGEIAVPFLLIVVGALWIALLELIGWALLIVWAGLLFFG